MGSNRERELADQVVSAINARDHSYIEKLTTDNVQLRLPPEAVFFGREGVRDFINTLEDLLPEATLVAHKIHAGEGFAVVEYDINSKTRAGSRLEGMGAIVLELGGDRIDRVQVYLDTAQWARIREGAV